MSNSRFFAVGENGTVLRSQDGGVTWAQLNVPTGVDLQTVYQIDANNVVAGGKDGTVIHSADGGNNWTIRQVFELDGVTPVNDAVIRNIHFIDANNGFAWASDANPVFGSFLIVTTNGGLRWDKVGNPHAVSLGSNDDGLGGQNTDGPLATEAGATGLRFRTATSGIAVGSQGTNAFNISSGGVNTGVALNLSGSGNYGLDAHFFDSNNGWLTTTTAELWFTTNGATSWSRVLLGPHLTVVPLTGVYDLGVAGEVVVVGYNGKIARVTPGAISVVFTVSSPTSANLQGVYRSADNEVIAVGDNGTIVQSSNNAQTFVIRASGTSRRLWSVHGIAGSVACNSFDATATVTNETLSGASDGEIQINTSGGNGPFEYQLGSTVQASNTFSNLAPGAYTIVARDTSNGCEVEVVAVVNAGSLAHTVGLAITNLSSTGATDGEINVSVSGGSGTFTYAWLDGPTSEDRTGLPAGTYTVNVTDTVTGIVVQATGVIADPSLVSTRPPVLAVPDSNSIRFHLTQSIDNCEVFENPINTMENGRTLGGYTLRCYSHKFQKCDTPRIQFKSNYATHLVELKDQSGNVIMTPTVELRSNNLAAVSTFQVELIDHTGGQTRVYPENDTQIISAGGAIQISNTATVNGIYIVSAVETDAGRGQDYMIINLVFPVGPSTILGTGATSNITVEYNIYEFELPFADIAEGIYQVFITFIDPDNGSFAARSEWVDVKTNQPDTMFLSWKNEGIKFGIDYNTGIEHIQRIPARMSEAITGGERSIFRDCNYTIIKTNARKTRRWRLQILQVPYYIHEILSIAFDHSIIRLNGLRYNTEEGYNEPQYIDLYNLANSEVIIEQNNWLNGLFRPLEGTDAGTEEDPITPPGIFDDSFDNSFQ